MLAIVGALLVTGGPRLGRIVRILGHDGDVQALVLGVAAARRRAILERREVLLCPRADVRPGRGTGTGTGDPCGRDWRAGVQIVAADGTVRWRSEPLGSSVSVRWRGFGSRRRLRWDPTGILRRQAGAFHVCAPEPGREARVVVSAVGRVRVERRRPGDPPLANARGRPLRCP